MGSIERDPSLRFGMTICFSGIYGKKRRSAECIKPSNEPSAADRRFFPPAYKNDLSSRAQARDLTGLYTITTFDIKFKNDFRAQQQMCIKGRLAQRGEFYVLTCVSLLFADYLFFCPATAFFAASR